jgi:hypothetical protein
LSEPEPHRVTAPAPTKRCGSGSATLATPLGGKKHPDVRHLERAEFHGKAVTGGGGEDAVDGDGAGPGVEHRDLLPVSSRNFTCDYLCERDTNIPYKLGSLPLVDQKSDPKPVL